jgi:hypothetical protein
MTLDRLAILSLVLVFGASAAASEPAVVRTSFPLEASSPAAEVAWRRPGAKSILALQRFQQQDVARVEGESGPRAEIVVTDLSPRIGLAYLAQIRRLDGAGTPVGPWHLRNADPTGQLLRADPEGLLLVTDQGSDLCTLWPDGDGSRLEAAAARGRELGSAWLPLCGGRAHMRLQVEGRKTRKEWTSDFLRDNLPAGEQLTVLVRKTLFADAELRTGVLQARSGRLRRLPGAPPPIQIESRWSDLTTAIGDLGLPVTEIESGRVPVGRWLPLKDGREGVWVSVFQPRLADPRTTKDSRLKALDEVELSSLDYLVAFDLAHHDLNFGLGTDHPRLGWSERVSEVMMDAGMPGPDGFDSGAPLVRNGQVPPPALALLQSTFTGGFKRSHGAFKHGDLARGHSGSHYGFVEDGVVWSKPVPGLATVAVWEDGRVDLLTWQSADDARLGQVRHLRQNGVPLLAPEIAVDGSSEVRVGPLVGNWSQGNWSGSQDQRLRSVRAGLCLAESAADDEGRRERFLIYGWFSAATPSGMARVFLAYGCSYALLLDMNALEHTYLSILTQTLDPASSAGSPVDPATLGIAHLVRGMEVLDKVRGKATLPRFVGFPDNRDFFYLTRKEAAEP